MSAHCTSCASDTSASIENKSYRRILWIALIANFTMFIVELIAGALGQSLSLTADAMDFFSDSANYAITLVVLGMSLQTRAAAALFKGICMGLVGLYVLYSSISHMIDGVMPQAEVMGVIGLLALLTNVSVALLLYRHRKGDANHESIWICSRNDAIANIAVISAGGGVWLSQTGWPDVLVGVGIAGLGLWGAQYIIRQSIAELRTA
ncbi:cation transporter [Pontibacter sp. JAM-7]|uniref:cation transporter n=1 Tax=Pontibacter sp. JAM-7 TaxID=3366581 RepID=UPI003AF4F1FC